MSTQATDEGGGGSVSYLPLVVGAVLALLIGPGHRLPLPSHFQIEQL